MINDKNNAIGCAMTRFQGQEVPDQNRTEHWHYLVCNYAYKNVEGGAVYLSGPTASKCKTVHETYKGLCTSIGISTSNASHIFSDAIAKLLFITLLGVIITRATI